MGTKFVESGESGDTKGHNNYIVYIIKRAPETWVYAASPGLSADLAAVVGLEFTIFGKFSENFRKNSEKFRLKSDPPDFYTAPYPPRTITITPSQQNTSETTPTALQSTKNSIF